MGRHFVLAMPGSGKTYSQQLLEGAKVLGASLDFVDSDNFLACVNMDLKIDACGGSFDVAKRDVGEPIGSHSAPLETVCGQLATRWLGECDRSTSFVFSNLNVLQTKSGLALYDAAWLDSFVFVTLSEAKRAQVSLMRDLPAEKWPEWTSAYGGPYFTGDAADQKNFRTFVAEQFLMGRDQNKLVTRVLRPGEFLMDVIWPTIEGVLARDGVALENTISLDARYRAADNDLDGGATWTRALYT